MLLPLGHYSCHLYITMCYVLLLCQFCLILLSLSGHDRSLNIPLFFRNQTATSSWMLENIIIEWKYYGAYSWYMCLEARANVLFCSYSNHSMMFAVEGIHDWNICVRISVLSDKKFVFTGKKEKNCKHLS